VDPQIFLSDPVPRSRCLELRIRTSGRSFNKDPAGYVSYLAIEIICCQLCTVVFKLKNDKILNLFSEIESLTDSKELDPDPGDHLN
jgi:hypothetical protein